MEFHRIIGSFELEETFKGQLVQLSCNEQEHLQLSQAAQRLIQPDLECLQIQGFHHLSGEIVLLPHHSYCKKCLPDIQFICSLF